MSINIGADREEEELHPLILHEDGKAVINKDGHKNTVGKTLFILGKSFIASGVLFLPRAFEKGGVLFSPIFIIFVGIVCMYSFIKLFHVWEVMRVDFGAMAAKLYGNWLKYAILVCITTSQLGFCCSYFGFLQMNLGELLTDHAHVDIPKVAFYAILIVICVPFVCIRNIGKFAYPSLVADVFIIAGLVYLHTYCFISLSHNGPLTELHLMNWSTFGVCIGTCVFAFEGVNMVIPVAESMQNPKKFPMCLIGIMALVGIVLASMGTVGYATFGDDVEEIITLNLPFGVGKAVIIILYSCAVFFTLPLMFFPALQILEPAVWGFSYFDKFSNKVNYWLQNLFRLLMLILVAVIAYIGGQNLTNFISIIGSCTGGPLCFVFPPMLHYRKISKTKTQKASDIILMIFGVVVFAYTLYESIISW